MKTLLAICLLFGATFSYAQESSDTFQIKDYKYRTPGFKALNFNFNFSGSFNRQGMVDSFSQMHNNIVLSPAVFNFYKVSSSDSRFYESYYSFSIEGSKSKIKSPYEDRKNSSGSVEFDWNINRQYFRRNNWFWELGNLLEIFADKYKYSSMNYYDDYSNLTIRDQPVVGLGKGRIEIVNDAQMALFILNDLEKEGLISNKGTAAQQYSFAQVITDINNQRIFDNRKKRIYELQRIDSFIKNSGLSTQTDIRHFSTINDNWVYAFNPVRHHGNRWYFRLRPGVEFSKSHSKWGDSAWQDERTVHYRTVLISSEAGYESRKATSLKWQRNFSLGLAYRYAYYNNNYTSFNTDYYSNYAEVSGSYTLGYFPNTRTYITAGIGANIQKGNFINNNQDGIRYTTGLNLQTSYFLGYRTRLLAGLGLNYTSQEIQPGLFTKTYQEYGFNTGVYCSISHSIF